MVVLRHSPKLQPELQVTMETPGDEGVRSMRLRGYVVRIENDKDKGHSSVGVVFTD